MSKSLSRFSACSLFASRSVPRSASTRGQSEIAIVPLAALLLFVLIFSSPPVRGQGQFGSIVGTVTDPSGATIPGANVTVKNNGTGATQTTTTNDQGGFTVVNLPPGSYSVTVTHPNFQSATQNEVDVTIGGATRADMPLSVGQATTTVEVTAPVPDLTTDSASLGGTVEGQQVVESPLNGRNVNNLLHFVPGVIPGGGTQGSTMANGGSGNFQVEAYSERYIAVGQSSSGSGKRSENSQTPTTLSLGGWMPSGILRCGMDNLEDSFSI